METFTTDGFGVVATATKMSNKLPIGVNRHMYESYPSFHSAMLKEETLVLSKLSKLIKQIGIQGSIQKRDLDEKFEMIVEANDTILERVGTLLDKMACIRTNPQVNYVAKTSEVISGSWNKKFLQKEINSKESGISNRSKNIEKPQIHFKKKVDNDRNTIFEPKINYKYNLLKPLSLFIEEDDANMSQYCHPYEFELEHFKPPPETLCTVVPAKCKPLEETTLKRICTKEDVTFLLSDLKNSKEIAVDLEHHSYRSFQGFTCLIQLSTRNTDFIIDTLALQEELHDLNEVFTDPKIVKVFHGSEMDIQWLQRDFGIYVVNMFDTYQAAKLLKFPQLSLAYLMKKYCNVDAQKHFQLDDWRVRPLPAELEAYAREDTHHLLYIYDNLKNLLIENANGQINLLKAVFSESTRICLNRYVKPVWDEEGYMNMYRKSKRLFDNRQFFALKRLYEWRDNIARSHDESSNYVLPNHMMLHISETLPREIQGIVACCNPVPPLVRQNLTALHHIILKAREQSLVKPIEEERSYHRSVVENNFTLDSPIRCFHDLGNEEFRDDLPVLIGSTQQQKLNLQHGNGDNLISLNPKINVFESVFGKLKRPKSLKANHMTPYQRYKLVKPFSEETS